MRLIKLQLRNFKGLRGFVFEPNGEDASVFGANATCKTTLADSFQWLLFGKDSLGRSDFEIKPLSESGEAEHGLEHEVQATLDLDGQELILRKVLTEKWSKPRGAPKQVFTGHTVEHFLQGVPVQKKEFDARISEIASEEIFRLLTNPRYFSEGLGGAKEPGWQARRRILTSIRDISDEDVIASKSELAGLPAILGKHKLEDYRKILAGRKTELNGQIKDIPVRISEQKRNIVDAGVQEGPARAKRAELEAERTALALQLQTLESGGAIAAKNRQIAEIDAALLRIESFEARKREDDLEIKRKVLGKDKFSIGIVKGDIETLGRTWTQNRQSIVRDTLGMAGKRAEFTAQNATIFEADGSCKCPICGDEHEIEQEKIEASRATFNISRGEALKGIRAEGKMLADTCAKLTAENEVIQENITAKNAELARLQGLIDALEAEMKNPAPAVTPPEADKLQQQKTVLQDEIAALANETARAEAVQEARFAIEVLDKQIQEQANVLAQIEQDAKSKKRIEELKTEERGYAGQLEKVESELFLTEEFVRTKTSMLEGGINSMFQLARFKLFSTQVNGQLSECCEITVNGVPYWSTNNASRINAGIDVANVLSEFYGITAVMFLDNCEAVNEVLPSKSQQIKLYVSTDPQLRIEYGV